MLTPRQFGLTLSPPISKQRVTLLCRQGRIPEAIKVGLVWAIPENAQITPVSRGRPKTENQDEQTIYSSNGQS